MPIRRRTAVPLTAGLAAALVLVPALAASAHVHVDPLQAKPGATDVGLTFTVPNEVPSARTTSVAIELPTDPGFGTVTATRIAGWRTAVSAKRIVFTATGDGIGAGQTQEFTLTVATVPDTQRVLIPVAQTYSNGEVVRWDEATPASGEEPEHPAPTLYVRATPPAEHDDDGDDAAVTTAQVSDDGTATAALAIGIGALAVAVVAVVVALIALARGRRPSR